MGLCVTVPCPLLPRPASPRRSWLPIWPQACAVHKPGLTVPLCRVGCQGRPAMAPLEVEEAGLLVPGASEQSAGRGMSCPKENQPVSLRALGAVSLP